MLCPCGIWNCSCAGTRVQHGRVLGIDPRDVPALRELPHSMLSRAYVTPGGDGSLFGEGGEVAVSITGLVKSWGE
jgi:hypothetical protein